MRRCRTVVAATLAILAWAAGGEARAGGFDLAFGVERMDGPFLGEVDQNLDHAFLDLEFGGVSSRVLLRVPYVRLNHTGLVTFAPDAPVILGAGGPGKPPWQGSGAGDGESGLGDILLRSETYLARAGAGNRPSVSFLADFKWGVADESKGLGTGENDWGAGFDYVQPLGKRLQILATANYWFSGSPAEADFDDRLRLAGGFAILSANTTWRLRYETVSPLLDEVPLYDASGGPIDLLEVDDYEVVRGEAVFRNQAGGSVKLWALAGLNDSSPDMAFGLTFASRPL